MRKKISVSPRSPPRPGSRPSRPSCRSRHVRASANATIRHRSPAPAIRPGVSPGHGDCVTYYSDYCPQPKAVTAAASMIRGSARPSAGEAEAVIARKRTVIMIRLCCRNPLQGPALC